MPAAPDAVWAVLADFPGIGRWFDGLDHATALTEASGGVGAARRIQVGRTTLVETVTEWDPPRRLAYTIEGLPAVVPPVTNGWDLVADGAGTSVTVTSSVAAGGPMSRVIGRLAGARLAKASDAMLAGLEREVTR